MTIEAHELLLGVDGGGTKTVALLAAAHVPGDEILGRGAAGPSNPNAVGWPQALHEVARAVAGAFQDARLQPGPVASACIALAGAARDAERRQVIEWAEETRLAVQTLAVHDALPILAAGPPDGCGVAVIAGTGSLVFGRDAGAREARAGGWGPLFGDEGSGYRLALAGLHAVAEAADGLGPATALTPRLCDVFAVDEPRQIVTAIYQAAWDRSAIAGLAKIVTTCAVEGDDAARRVVDLAAGRLADAVVAVRGHLDLPADALPLALAGGLVIHSDVYRQTLLDAVAARGVALGPVHVVQEPALGALRLARGAPR